ncbi:MAG: type II secretion system protein [Clostridiales bacterium]|nr:type II secretion system protein [Clostridiales bacterium]
MRKILNKSTHSKKAFTLLEIILAMAIMVIVIPMVFGTFYLIYRSHAEVTVLNDAKDYASLNVLAINNLVENASSAKASGSFEGANYMAAIYVKDGELWVTSGSGDTQAFDYPQYTLADGTKKWDIGVSFSVLPPTKTIKYTVTVYDNANPGVPYYTLDTSIYLPNGNRNGTELLEASSGSWLNYSNPVP